VIKISRSQAKVRITRVSKEEAMGKYDGDLVDLCLIKVAETDKAIKVTDGILDASGERTEIWLPKSQVEITNNPDKTVDITMPEWLAIDKGLV